MVRGPLDAVGGYVVDLDAPLPGSTCIVDPEPPPPGLGFYYAVRLDCPSASWQSSLGAEPDRDSSLP